MMKTYIIIGTSAAGMANAITLRSLDITARIICISREMELPYNKCLLADYLEGIKSLQQIYTKSPLYLEKERIELFLGTEVVAIDRSAQSVFTACGKQFFYDSLFLGVGASGMKFPESAQEGVFAFNTLADTEKIKRFITQKKVKSAIIIGAGLTGLECASSLFAQGIAVTIVDKASRILHNQLDEEGALFLQELLEHKGVSLLLNDLFKGSSLGSGQVSEALFLKAGLLQTDMIIFASGIRACLSLARTAHLEHTDEGIIINNFLQTSDPFIYAGGDVALVPHRFLNCSMRNIKWSDAAMQGVCAAYNMVGIAKAYQGIAPILSTHIFGIDLTMTFSSHAEQPHCAPYKVMRAKDFYHAFLMRDTFIQSFIMIGEAPYRAAVRQAYLQQIPVNKESFFPNAF